MQIDCAELQVDVCNFQSKSWWTCIVSSKQSKNSDIVTCCDIYGLILRGGGCAVADGYIVIDRGKIANIEVKAGGVVGEV